MNFKHILVRKCRFDMRFSIFFYQLNEVALFLYGIVVPQVLLLAYLERVCLLPEG